MPRLTSTTTSTVDQVASKAQTSPRPWPLKKQSITERRTHETFEKNTYGRLLSDTKGARKPFCSKYACCFYDASRESGTNFLKSYAITSALAATEDTEAEKDNCRAFINRYFANHKVFDNHKTAEELTEALEGLLDQLYHDITYRRLRKTSGDNQVQWVNTLLATSVSIISFARNIIPQESRNPNADNHEIINYLEGGAALGALIFTKITNTSTQDDVLAANALEKLRKWVKKVVTTCILEKQNQAANLPAAADHGLFAETAISLMKPHFQTRLPIEEALYHERYMVQPSENLNYSLFDAISKLRALAGFPSSISAIDKAIKANYSAELDIEKNETNTVEMIERLSRLYDCPIIVMQEQSYSNGKYCNIIHEVFLDDEETKNDKTDVETRQQKREKNTLILYSAEPGYYQPVVPRKLQPERTFETIKAELMAMRPVISHSISPIQSLQNSALEANL